MRIEDQEVNKGAWGELGREKLKFGVDVRWGKCRAMSGNRVQRHLSVAGGAAWRSPRYRRKSRALES